MDSEGTNYIYMSYRSKELGLGEKENVVGRRNRSKARIRRNPSYG